LIHCFILIFLQYPELIKAVQAEFDTVLGVNGPPPTLEDLSRLPKMFALTKETLRWFPVTPLAFPHVAEKTDMWKGMKV
jgi:cytochrome P450